MRRNAAIWTAAVVSAALMTGLGTAGEASAAPKSLVVAPNGDDSAPGTLARPLNSVAYGNGFNRWNFPDFAGDGNGFKLGGGTPAPAAGHTVRNSVAFKNAAHGFTDNGNSGALALTRDSAYANAGTGFDTDTAGGTATLTASLSVADGRAAALGSATVSKGNSWDLGGTWNASSVLSTDPAPLTGPRTADGSLPSAPQFLVPRRGANIGARF